MNPHVWTMEQVKALPMFGANKGVGWFYALVEDTFTDDEGEKATCLILAEVYPGMGYSLVHRDELDEESWPMILADLGRPLPPELGATAPASTATLPQPEETR